MGTTRRLWTVVIPVLERAAVHADHLTQAAVRRVSMVFLGMDVATALRPARFVVVEGGGMTRMMALHPVAWWRIGHHVRRVFHLETLHTHRNRKKTLQIRYSYQRRRRTDEKRQKTVGWNRLSKVLLQARGSLQVGGLGTDGHGKSL